MNRQPETEVRAVSTTGKTAFLFPGQGAHCSTMLDGLTSNPNFKPRYRLVADRLGVDPLTRLAELEFVNANKVSSLLTVLASSLSLDGLNDRGVFAAYVAGYSVGQWTALYAAGCLSFEDLVEVVYARATFMDECFSNRTGAMLAVIGLPLQEVEDLCAEIRAGGKFLTVSNFNCLGQYSLAGDSAAVEEGIARLETTCAKKVQRLPVAGAWHCELLAGAEAKLLAYLRSVTIKSPMVPVCDNVSGEFLPADEEDLKVRLAAQVASPLQWERCIQRLCSSGCAELVEVGFGNVLTKFGFFINRKVTHRTFYSGANGK